MTQELKPCPFCGSGDAGIVRAKTIFDHVIGFMVLCPDCGCTVGFNTDTEFTAFTDFSTEQDAIAAWNTRAERTCCNDDYGDTFVCSECGANVSDTYVGRSYVDEWGKRWYATSNEHQFNYCPNCGAKVVGK